MNQHEETYHLIEQYLNHELSGDALIQFENELHTNRQLAAELEVQQLTREITVQASNFELRNKIKTGVHQFDKQQTNRKYTQYGVGALILLVGITSYFYFNTENKTTEQLPTIQPKAKKTVVVKPLKTEKLPREEKTTELTESQPVKHFDKVVVIDSSQKQVEKETIAQPTLPREEKKQAIVVEEPKKNQTTPISSVDTAIQSITPKPFDCSNTTITAQPQVTAPCVGEANGEVVFTPKNIKGGTPPYRVQYKNEVASAFKDFFAGYYHFTIVDYNKCTSKIEVELQEKACLKTSHTLNLSFETELLLYKSTGVNAKLTVFNKNGVPIYESISDGDVIWNGTDSSGELQRSGLYYYMIKTASETINGQVTILN